MKYIQQVLIIASITFVAELIKYLVPLPIPASIYGLIILFALLKSGLLKLSQIEDVGGLLLELMPLLLVPASVSFLTALDSIQNMLLPVLIMGFLGTLVVMGVTGKICQWMIRHGKGAGPVGDFFVFSAYFGLFVTLGTYQLARFLNRRMGREVCNPLLFATLCCIALLLLTDTDYQVYYESGANILDFFLTPATICLAIPLYRQFTLLKKNTLAVLAGCVSGVLAHMLGCVLMLFLFQLEGPEFITLLPKSITTAIGKGLSEELGGYPAITMATIMVTGLFGAVIAPAFLKLLRITDPLAQGLAIGTSSHAAGTSRAVELGDIQGAASSLAIVVTGLLTVVAAPLCAMLVG